MGRAVAVPVERQVWLLITGHGSWHRLLGLGEWAFPEKALSRVEEIQAEDLGVVYLTQDGGDCSLGGVVRFGEDLRKIQPQGFFDTLYPYRRPIEVVRAPRSPVPFRPLVEELGFIRNKKNWGLYFQGHPLRPLSQTDAKRLLGAMGVT